MGTNNYSFSPMWMTCCFLLVIILFTTASDGFSARTLQSITPYGNEGGAKNQSKGEVGASVPSHDGSAAGNSTPPGGVKVSPPTSVTRISYGSLSYSPPPPPPYYSRKTVSAYSPPVYNPDEPVSAYDYTPPSAYYPDEPVSAYDAPPPPVYSDYP